MTREERLDWLCRLRSKVPVYMPCEWIKSMNEALTDTIKELEQEDALDKITEEVKQLDNANPLNFGYVDVVYREDVLEIIDKYEESEE